MLSVPLRSFAEDGAHHKRDAPQSEPTPFCSPLHVPQDFSTCDMMPPTLWAATP